MVWGGGHLTTEIPQLSKPPVCFPKVDLEDSQHLCIVCVCEMDTKMNNIGIVETMFVIPYGLKFTYYCNN